MKHPANIEEVAALHPDFMGFIFYPKSPRFVGDEFLLGENVTRGVSRVGVFVNEKLAAIQRQTDKVGLSFIQLHGDEPQSFVKEVRQNHLRVIKAFRVDSEFDFASTKPFAEYVDYFLFDTKGKHYGGNAQRFNWTLLEKYDQQIPFFLSGGITAEDMPQLKKLNGMNLHAVDVNSGVEGAPGVKDINKIKELINKLNNE